MSEFKSQSSVGLLLGNCKTDTGMLGRALDQETRGTLLFDEMEKAHPLVLDLFLQMLDAGRITLADGKTKSLNNYYIVFTSNVGSADAMRMESSAFATIERTVLRRVDQTLRPELVARINEKFVFDRLAYTIQREICEQMVEREVDRLSAMGYNLVITPSTIELLVREGYHRTLGARPMRNTVDRFFQNLVRAGLLAYGGDSESSPTGALPVRVILKIDIVNFTCKSGADVRPPTGERPEPVFRPRATECSPRSA